MCLNSMCLRNQLDIPGGENILSGEGDTETQRRGFQVLQILVGGAHNGRTITFTELMEDLELEGEDYNLLIGPILRNIVKTLAEFENGDDWEGEIPHITSIVMTETGCSRDMCELLTGDPQTQPSPEQLQTELECSFYYDLWDDVLDTVLPPEI